MANDLLKSGHVLSWHHSARRVLYLSQTLANKTSVELKQQAIDIRVKFQKQQQQPEDVLIAAALLTVMIQKTRGITPHLNQLIAGLAMLDGYIIEMHTGEGKTLTALYPAFMHGLAGRGCHLITANDYLAARDGQEAKLLFHELGVSMGIVTNKDSRSTRSLNYKQDVVYTTEKEIGFDWLKETERWEETQQFKVIESPAEMTVPQIIRSMFPDHAFHALVVDEADSILIDRAYTPLIMAEERELKQEELELGKWCYQIFTVLEAGLDYEIKSEQKRASLTALGRERVMYQANRDSGIKRIDWSALFQTMDFCLTANLCYHLQQDYAYKEGHLEIIDVHTGRIIPGRKWQNGLHLAIEIKEKHQQIKQTATTSQMTMQQLVGLYKHVSGMTGTARGCQQEITRDYKIPLVFLPARLPPQREEFSPQIFTSKKLKYLFIVQELKQQSESGRAILVGTTSIQESQELADLLMSYRLNHRVLNAIQDAHEAEVVSKAGEAGQITIATNMAGRGTDIKISAEVRKTGGLHIILTGMQASSRLDRQMIGRCARQGEPGSFCYRLSLEDDLIQQLPANMQHEFAALNKQADRYGLLPTACFKNFKQAQIYLERNSKDSFSRNHKYAVARNQLVKYLEIPVELVTS